MNHLLIPFVSVLISVSAVAGDEGLNQQTAPQGPDGDQPPTAQLQQAAKQEQVLYQIDFTSQPEGPAAGWLRSNGYEFKLDFEGLNPKFESGCLKFSAKRPMAGVCGIAFAPGRDIAGAKKARITWGVGQYPEGANWEKGINRMAIGVMISFGQERLPSGLPLGLMDAPYFICPFLGKDEPAGKLYTGQYWTKGGRYLSVTPSKDIPTTVTEIDLREQFRKAFPGNEVPAVSAIGFQMNTKDTMGIASAFIKKIEVLGE